MKQSPLKPGARSLARGTTFSAEPKPLKRSPSKAKPKGISPASKSQRAKASWCIVTGSRKDEGAVIDPSHLAARGRGGCDDPLCVVGLRRDIHRAFDDGNFDVLPFLLAHGCVEELQHALGHYDGDLLGLLQRLTSERWVPERRVA